MLITSTQLLLLALLLLLQTSVISPTAAPPPILHIVSSISSQPNTRLTPQPDILFTATRPPSSTSILSLDTQQRFQSILGFGGAFTQAAGSQFVLLPQALQSALIQAYFNSTHGHAYNMGRVPMNSCDYSQFTYSYDDTADDYDLSRFDVKASVDSGSIIPFIQHTLNFINNSNPQQHLLLFTAPWSPPAWMKNSHQMNGSSTPCLISDTRVYTAWANYFVRWFQVYRTFGIDFWGYSIQNEPLNNPPWEGCIYPTAQDQLAFFLSYLYPAVSQAFPQLQVMAWDFNKDNALDWISHQFANTTAYPLFWGTSLHWYAGARLDQMDAMHALYPNKHLLATESCICPDVHLDEWGRGEQYMSDIMGNLNHWSVGYVDWNLLLNNQGGPTHVGESCDSSVIVRWDLDPVVLHFQPMYYAIGHYSRFLPRGAQRIGNSVTGAGTTLQFTTWLRGSSRAATEEVVIVVMNESDQDQTLYVQAGVLYANVSVPARSWHSLTFDASLLASTQTVTE